MRRQATTPYARPTIPLSSWSTRSSSMPTSRAPPTSISSRGPGREQRARALSQRRRAARLPRSCRRKFRAAMVSRIKIMANLDISEQRKRAGRQDRLQALRPGRTSSCGWRRSRPTTAWRTSVLRVLAGGEPLPLDELGSWRRRCCRACARVAEKPYGLILVCGPDRLGQDHDAAFGARAPQHAGHARSGRPKTRWRSPSRACARCRSIRRSAGPSPRRCARFCGPIPDVIMVGEMRDEETAAHRDRSVADRTPGAVHAAHQQRARERHAPARHGPGPVQLRRCAAGRARPAPARRYARIAPSRRKPTAPR